jgi:hypothetical protein
MFTTSAPAQHALATGGNYDARVPTPQSVLGYEVGERFTPHHLLHRYFERVAQASGRVVLDTVAHTFEGRELLLAIVTSEANHARLEEIRAANARLADPRGAGDAELDALVRSTPSVVWLGYTVHGSEASGAEAAIALLYQLAAAQDADTRAILDSTVVLIDPVQNPDGHERHAQDVMRARGAFGPQPQGFAMIHSGSWPGPRTSHYYFDLNRDWFAQSHPETRGRIATMLAWNPHTAVDLHEMGSSSTYYFAPPMEPVNANVHSTIYKWWDIYAGANAAAFDRFGWSFFRREDYDDFYPGYGDSWPTFAGAVGMTYEQASSNGGAIERSDGTIMTLQQAARHHYTASFATALVTARRRHERVADYLTFRQTAISDNLSAPIRQIVIDNDAQGRADSLVALLLRSGIEVQRLGAETQARDARAFGAGAAANTRLPADAYVVDLAQPMGRLAKALLEPDAALDSAFIAEELENRRTGQGDRFYDITAWALPYLFRLNAWTTSSALSGLQPVTAVTVSPPAPPPTARYGYAFEPGSEAAARMLAALLADSVKVWHAQRWFRAGGRHYPDGAFVIRVAPNDDDVHDIVRRLATETGSPVFALESALVDDGTDLGSGSVYYIDPPRIGLVGNAPVNGNSFGSTWYTFDQRLRYPVIPVAVSSLSANALSRLDLLVVPSAGNLNGTLGEAGRERLGEWVRNGGTIVALDGAVSWLMNETTDLSRFRPRRDTVRADSTAGAPLSSNVPGALVRAAGDTLSPLMAGIRGMIPVLHNSDRVIEQPKNIRAGEVVVRIAPLDSLRLAGYMWPEVPERLAETPWMWTESVGSGRIIAFAGDPNFRDILRGMLPLFANAVFLGPSM